MTISDAQFQYMVEGMTSDLIRLVMENENLTMPEAFNKVYNSKTYEHLLNPKSLLYYQSVGYIYAHLCSEK
jgi:hypothetical protein